MGASLLTHPALLTAQAASAPATSRTKTAKKVSGIDGDQALQMLMAGNKRYVAQKSSHPHQTARYRRVLAQGQHPFAVILSCSDSRVPPEIIFDQGLGDLFAVRVAGNIADEAVMGSIEYAAEHLGAHLLVVLGHERCGAVQAAVDAVLKGSEAPGHIRSIVQAIKPAVESAKGQPGDLLDNAVRANVKMVVGQLSSSDSVLAELTREGKLRVEGARYDLDSGRVDILAL